MTPHTNRLPAFPARGRVGAAARPAAWLRRTLIALPAALLCTSAASASCWETAGARYDIHPWLLAAIAKVESGFDPSAVNSAHVGRTGSVDLGLMQINSTWLPVLARHGITRERLFDPCTSITVGAWILAGLFARYGVTWEAIGAYNAACVRLDATECTRRRAGYARKVDAALRELSGKRPVELASSAARRIVHVSIGHVRAAAAANASAAELATGGTD
jgi:soluble lytic murein transglycosylase-like protein